MTAAARGTLAVWVNGTPDDRHHVQQVGGPWTLQEEHEAHHGPINALWPAQEQVRAGQKP